MERKHKEYLELYRTFEPTERCLDCPLCFERCELDCDGFPDLATHCSALDAIVQSLEDLHNIEMNYMCPGICDVCDSYSPDCSYIKAGLHTPH